MDCADDIITRVATAHARTQAAIDRSEAVDGDSLPIIPALCLQLPSPFVYTPASAQCYSGPPPCYSGSPPGLSTHRVHVDVKYWDLDDPSCVSLILTVADVTGETRPYRLVIDEPHSATHAQWSEFIVGTRATLTFLDGVTGDKYCLRREGITYAFINRRGRASVFSCAELDMALARAIFATSWPTGYTEYENLGYTARPTTRSRL